VDDLEVSPLDTTSILKVKIQQHWGFPVMQQQLSYKEERLVDGKSLFNYNVQNEDTLQLELHSLETRSNLNRNACKDNHSGKLIS